MRALRRKNQTPFTLTPKQDLVKWTDDSWFPPADNIMNCEIPNKSVFSHCGQVTTDGYHHTDVRENTECTMDNTKQYYGFNQQQQDNPVDYDQGSSSCVSSIKNSNDRGFVESVKCIPSSKINNIHYPDANFNLYEQSEHENNRNIGNVYYENYQNSRNCFGDFTSYERDDIKSEITNSQDILEPADYTNANTQESVAPQVSPSFNSKDTLSPGLHDDNLQTVKACVNLRNRELWLKFYEHTTEMIITKQGR